MIANYVVQALITMSLQRFANTRHWTTVYDIFLLGPETRGLPPSILDIWPPDQRLRIPMRPDNRSLNLSNAAAVVLYEAWRQNGFVGGT
jgi:tRNA (cytidine/uridine-2'-O-)-methyltransferase